ncbi:MAG: hypothetical protein LBT50_08525 [Prevotellaceae bacterium]|jgi:hypothetical protein|nr:hypothetical protein [Prevotellaceae bacterium]
MNKLQLKYAIAKCFGYVIAGLLFAYIAGCSEMDDTQREYLDRGEKIYVGKIDSLTVHGGHNRVKITGLMYYAYSAEKCIIRWKTDLVNDSITVSLAGLSAQDTFSVVIALDEGTYQFFVQTYDREGNKSLNEECYGYSYGNQFILQASSKLISQMKPEPSGITLLWNDSEQAEGVEVVYESNSGDEILKLSGDVRETVLPDWKIGGYIKSRTALIPETGAIDTLYTDWLVQYFPASVEYEIVKTQIVPLRLSNDATTGYNGRNEGVFDDIINGDGAQFHSGDGVGVPQHLTFDLGVKTNLTRLEIWARSDGYNNWNPKKIEFWGIENISGAEITIPSMDPNWENEAVAKGWTKLLAGTCNDPVNNKLTFDTSARIRYLIIRTTEVYGGPSSGSGAYVILREITLYADSITPID